MALLNQGDMFPTITAVSGWSLTGIELEAIDNIHWTDKVLRICNIIGDPFVGKDMAEVSDFVDVVDGYSADLAP